METVPDVSPEVPPRVWRLLLGALERLPQRAMSRSFARVADLHLPVPLRGPILGAFARSVGVDLTEAEHPLTAYPSLDAFFVRRLRPGARTWPDTPAIAAPVPRAAAPRKSRRPSPLVAPNRSESILSLTAALSLPPYPRAWFYFAGGMTREMNGARGAPRCRAGSSRAGGGSSLRAPPVRPR